MTQFSPLKYLLLILTVCFFNPTAYAADIKAGKNKAKNCFGCHGMNGQSNIPAYPKLAGQKARYLETQLLAFKSGQRENMMMQHVASNLDQQQIENLAAFFARQKNESTESSKKNKQSEQKLAMCKGCHGNKLEGRGNTPRLAGQHDAYLKKQLINFKNKTRTAGPMNSITASLSEQDISEIAEYLANY